MHVRCIGGALRPAARPTPHGDPLHHRGSRCLCLHAHHPYLSSLVPLTDIMISLQPSSLSRACDISASVRLVNCVATICNSGTPMAAWMRLTHVCYYGDGSPHGFNDIFREGIFPDAEEVGRGQKRGHYTRQPFLSTSWSFLSLLRTVFVIMLARQLSNSSHLFHVN